MAWVNIFDSGYSGTITYSTDDGSDTSAPVGDLWSVTNDGHFVTDPSYGYFFGRGYLDLAFDPPLPADTRVSIVSYGVTGSVTTTSSPGYIEQYPVSGSVQTTNNTSSTPAQSFTPNPVAFSPAMRGCIFSPAVLSSGAQNASIDFVIEVNQGGSGGGNGGIGPTGNDLADWNGEDDIWLTYDVGTNTYIPMQHDYDMGHSAYVVTEDSEGNPLNIVYFLGNPGQAADGFIKYNGVKNSVKLGFSYLMSYYVTQGSAPPPTLYLCALEQPSNYNSIPASSILSFVVMTPTLQFTQAGYDGYLYEATFDETQITKPSAGLLLGVLRNVGGTTYGKMGAGQLQTSQTFALRVPDTPVGPDAEDQAVTVDSDSTGIAIHPVVSGTYDNVNITQFPNGADFYWDPNHAGGPAFVYVPLSGTGSYVTEAKFNAVMGESLGREATITITVNEVPDPPEPVSTSKHFVYELDRGFSFDGNYIPHFLVLNWSWGESPVQNFGTQKVRVHGLTKGNAYIQIQCNGLETKYSEDGFQQPQYIDMLSEFKFVSDEFTPLSSGIDYAARGIAVQMKFSGRNLDITKPEPAHVMQVLVTQSNLYGSTVT